jgi:hypothetical protein
MALHENPHVDSALRHLDLALSDLNLADAPYAIGVTGVDEPYGMVERALTRTLHHAFPDLDPDEIMQMRVESGEDLRYCVRHLRREREQSAEEARELLTPFEQYRREPPSGKPGAMWFELPNGRFVSVIPSSYFAGLPEEALRAQAFDVISGTALPDGDVSWDEGSELRVGGLLSAAYEVVDRLEVEIGGA